MTVDAALLAELQETSRRMSLRWEITARHALLTKAGVPERCRPRRGKPDGQPDKVIFETEQAVYRCISAMENELGLLLRPYRCRRPKVDHWHMATRQPKPTKENG